MQDSKNVFIFGYSGHAYVLIETMRDLGFTILGYFDKKKAIVNPYNLEYLGFEVDVDLKSIIKDDYVFPTVGENFIREKLLTIFDEQGLKQFVIIDKTANVSQTAKIGFSTYIGKSVCVNALAKIGKGVILNTSAVIDHECEIGDFAHIAPSATLAGNVKVGRGSFVGANSVCKQNIIIGKNSILGAGSSLVKNVADNETWMGNPAKKFIK